MDHSEGIRVVKHVHDGNPCKKACVPDNLISANTGGFTGLMQLYVETFPWTSRCVSFLAQIAASTKASG
jgi:hypothetical protein